MSPTHIIRTRSRAAIRRVVVAGGVLGLSALSGLAARAVDPSPCTAIGLGGGEWSTYGGDLHGTQRQDAEHTIGVENVGSLTRAWITDDTGYQSPAPIVSGGCVFINTGGHIDALHLETGETVWQSAGADTSGTFAVTVVEGRVHVGLNNGGKPKAAAFDVTDGHLLWESDEVWFGYRTSQQASAIVHDGIQVLFTTGPDFDPDARQGYALIDAATGDILHSSTTVPPDDLEAGYAGGGVWGTPTVDPDTGYLYVGTSNPESKTKEHAYDNAIIKVDLDRDRPTFGRIVGSFKGTPDSVTGYDNPVCQTAGDTLWVNAGIYGSSPTCGQLDVDFGSGPTLWRDASGRLLGAATQKSGWLHVFDAETMTRVWDRQLFVTTSFAGGNIGRIATDGQTLYVAANPGILHAFDAEDGTARWRAPLTGLPMKGGNVALANGVVYYVDEPAVKAWDAATGDALWISPVTPAASIGSGVAVAGHHVVVNHFGTIAAYRLPSLAVAGSTSLPELPAPGQPTESAP
ncbi:MAG TPA: PQQ-binding-like beta-propeller repeat protein [Acidimicrobiales bacterium]